MVDPRTIPLRFSRLKCMAQSPAHYFHACQDEDPDTLAMRLGSGAHAILFDQTYHVYDGIRRGKEWEAFEVAHAGELILNRKEFEKAFFVAEAVRNHRTAMKLLDKSCIEQRIHWSFGGRACSGTPDAFSGFHLVDLKTTRCAHPERFGRDAQFRAYHAQLAWYLDGLEAAGLGLAKPRDVYIIAVESAAPHPVTILRLTEQTLDLGRRLYRTWLEQVRVCEESNLWPGYAEEPLDWHVAAPLDLDGLEMEEEVATP